MVRAAVVQLESAADRDANLAAADTLVRAAARDGADFVVLPEKWPALGSPEQLEAGAEPADGTGPALSWACAIAAELGIDVVAGSITELTGDGGRNRNTSVLVGRDGRILARYAKTHLFDSVVDGVTYSESAIERAGDELVVARSSDGVGIGMTVCYDLRFPELHRALAAAGARVLTVPSAFTLATTRDHWEILLRARAIENACFVLAANQHGAMGDGRLSGGRSMIVDPWGTVLATVPDGAGQATATLDFARQDTIRERLPVLEHRRPELYMEV